jgi:CubicO group peptidase (beta-lactamase class C family)
MSGISRALPGHPSVRFLKIEAKRRLAAGEFASLHAAQQAIAAEFGQPNWATLKTAIGESAAGPAMDQLAWVIERFADATGPGWIRPSDDELRDHFSAGLLTAGVVDAILSTVPRLDRTPKVLAHSATAVDVELGNLLVHLEAESDPPYRITELAAIPRPREAVDPRTEGKAPRRIAGEPPASMRTMADQVFTAAGAPALIVAGPGWTIATGWSDLGRGEAADPDVRLPVPGVSGLVIAVAVLRLVADGRLTLDAPVNDHLTTLRLADSGVTVRELLSHTGGVDNPAPLYGDHVPPLTDLLGPVVAETGKRGVLRPSNGGVALLAQLVADLTGEPFPAAAARLVFDPLGIAGAAWPDTPAATATEITGYDLTDDGRFTPVPRQVCTVPAAGGLEITAPDLIRLGLGWSTLLPGELAAATLSAQTTGAALRCGLGWLLSPHGDLAMHSGAGAGFTAALLLRTADRAPLVMVASKVTPLGGAILEPVLRIWIGGGK